MHDDNKKTEFNLNSFKESTAAAYLGVSQSFLRQDRIGKQLVPFRRIGRAIRYLKSDLDEFLMEHKTGGLRHE